MDTMRPVVHDRYYREHVPDRRWRSHPMLGLLILGSASGSAGWGLDILMRQAPLASHLPGGHIAALFAAIVLLLFVLRAADSLFRGRLFFGLARVLFWGFPTVVESVAKLVSWYQFEDLLRVPPDERTAGEQLRLEALRRELVEHYLTHGSTLDLEAKRPFSSWMIAEVVPHYENNVEALAYLGAGFLIVVVGLRGIGYISKDEPELILLSIFLEFSIIGLMALVKFYTPERSGALFRPDGKGMIKPDDTHAQIAEIKKGWSRLELRAREIDGDFRDFRKRLERLDHSLG